MGKSYVKSNRKWSPKTPYVTADIIIELTDRPERPIVLIERKNPPHGWALPGGFVDRGERLEQAAVREAEEETGLRVRLKILLGIYSDPERDPRLHTVGAVYVAEAQGDPAAADDAKNVAVHTMDNLPDLLAFDHGRILSDYAHYRKTQEITPLWRAE